MKIHSLRAGILTLLCLLLGGTSSLLAAESGVTEGKILLGMSLPLSGVVAGMAAQEKEGAMAYFQQLNGVGGVAGRKLELAVLDDGFDAAKAMANTRRLIEEQKVFALMGYIGTGATLESAKVFTEAKVPLVGAISGADGLRTPVNRYLFNLRASYAEETEVIVHQLVSLGIRQIAVFYQNDSFGKSGLDGVNRALKRHGLSPAALGTVERNTVAVEQAVETIARANPQAVVMVTTAKPVAAFVRQMKAKDRIAQFSSISTAVLESLVQDLVGDSRGLGISQVMPYPWNETVPVVREYQKALLAYAGHRNYSYYGLEGYLNAKLMAEALKRCGKDLTREKLVAVLEAMNEVDLGGFRISYSPTDHGGSRFVDLTVIGQNGKLLR